MSRGRNVPQSEATHTPPPSLREILGPSGRLAERLPNYEYRPQQMEAASAVVDALERHGLAVIEAGTGVGKSLAYLVPLALALASGGVAVVSTFTINLQCQLADKDVPLLRSLLPEIDIRPALLKGRSNYLCKQDLEIAASDLFHTAEPMFKRLTRWAAKTKTGDSAELTFSYPRWSEVAANTDTCRARECRFFDQCHYFGARRRAAAANLIVVNHALLLTDLISRDQTESGEGILPSYGLLIIDEAHHLEDAATSVFSIDLGDWELPALADRIRRTHRDGELSGAARLEGLSERLFAHFRGRTGAYTVSDKIDATEWQAVCNDGQNAATSLAEATAELQATLADASETEKERTGGLIVAAGRLHGALGSLLTPAPTGVVDWCETLGSGGGTRHRGRADHQRLILHRSPIDVAALLAEKLWSGPAACVLTSATLASLGNFAYVRARLGLPETATEHLIGSPFDFRSQALLYVPAHLPEPRREADDSYVEAVVDELERIVRLSEGRAFLLFTSRRMLAAVHRHLAPRVPFPLFKQGDLPPAKLLQAFRDSRNGCLLGNQTFWEGVDVQGDALSVVVIDRLPFAAPDTPITRARTEALTAAGRNWFTEYSLPQAQIRLKQGFGRLIRTHEDRGMVCILDTRLLNKWYGPHFVQHLPPATRASVWARVERFWKHT